MRAWLQRTVATVVVAMSATAVAGEEPEFEKVKLVSDQPGHAKFTDPDLVNPWGLAASPTSPFWAANNGSNTATLYNGAGVKQALTVDVPGNPTGQVFYGGDKFIVCDMKGHTGAARFIFAAEDGTVSAWSPNVPPGSTQAFVMYDGSDEGDVYKGLAIATDHKGRTHLYATDFHNARIVELDDQFDEVELPKHAFRDRDIPRGYAPFGIATIGRHLFVTYAKQDKDRHDDVAGPGHGFIDEYDLDGRLERRVASRGALNSPWGLAIGPESFGRFDDTLLVGNFGDGRIHAYRQWTNGQFTLEGTIADQRGLPIVIPGLWAIVPGNDGRAGSSKDLYFTAGPEDELHGLFGLIRRSSDQLVGR
jgi:uncharacterized protein (TIGR03118 family)